MGVMLRFLYAYVTLGFAYRFLNCSDHPWKKLLKSYILFCKKVYAISISQEVCINEGKELGERIRLSI